MLLSFTLLALYSGEVGLARSVKHVFSETEFNNNNNINMHPHIFIPII